MIILVSPTDFKIRSKHDAELFITKYLQGDGETVIKVSEYLVYKICRYGSTGTITICMKTGDIYNMFNPDICIGEYCLGNGKLNEEALKKTIDAVYIIRKHINAYWFKDEEALPY